MKQTRRLLSVLILLALLVANSGFTGSVYAEEIKSMPTETQQDGAGEVEIKGTNSAGALLADSFWEKMDEQEENNGCNIFSVEMDGNTASVTYETTQYAEIVIGIYDDEGTALFATGTAEAVPGETYAEVLIETDRMPDYFYIRGFLADKECKRPLCTVYGSPNYTKEMQEFLAKTTADFDADRVLNFDADQTNNFAVYGEETVILDENGSTNIVTEIREETNTYVIEKIDESVASCKAGDIFVYEYKAGTVLIVKIASIEIKGTTAVITGAETSLEEVFQFVKINETSYTEDITVDDSACEEGVTYKGVVEAHEDGSEGVLLPNKLEGDGSIGYEHQFDFDKELGNHAKLTGSLNVQITTSVKFYYEALGSKYVEVILDYSAKAAVTFSGEASCSVPIGYFIAVPVPGVTLEFTPSFVAEISAEVELSGTLSGSVGFRADKKEGITNLSTMPEFKTELKGEVTIFIGLALKPEITFIDDCIAHASLEAKLGAEICGTIVYTIEFGARPGMEYHECESCLDGDINAKLEINFEAEFLSFWDETGLKWEYSIDLVKKLKDFYYSFDFNEFDFGSCPHNRYKTGFTVTDAKGVGLKDASIHINRGDFVIFAANGEKVKTQELTAGSGGKSEGYLPAGNYSLQVRADGYVSRSVNIQISDEAKSYRVLLTKQSIPEEEPGDGSEEEPGDGSEEEPGDGSEEPDKMKTFFGGQNSAAIMADGSLYMWGCNGTAGTGSTEDVAVPTKILEDVETVSIDQYTSTAITKDGSLYRWGYNSGGQVGNGSTEDVPIPAKILDHAKTVLTNQDISAERTGVITTDGSLYMWGRNPYGEVGNGTTEFVAVPVKILDNVETAEFGYHTGAAITTDGSLYMWGANSSGEVGNGTTDIVAAPVKVLDHVKYVDISDSFSMAVTENNDLYTWGKNVTIPTKIMEDVKTASIYESTYVVITNNGDLYIWGNNKYGQVGKSDEEYITAPCKVLENVETVSADQIGFTIIAITKDASLFMWGSNIDGQVGNGKGSGVEREPFKVLENVETASLYNGTSIAVTKDDRLYMWGYSFHGEVGNGSDTKVYEPFKVLESVETASTYEGTSVAVTTDGSLYMWGDNRYGQVGNGRIDTVKEPFKVLENVETVSIFGDVNFPVARSTSAALTKDGNLYMWGYNDCGQTGTGSKELRITVPTKVEFPLAIQTNRAEEQMKSSHPLDPYTVAESAVNLLQAEFTGLTPNGIYNFYVMENKDAAEPFGSANLLYLTQERADKSGVLKLSYLPVRQQEGAACFVVPMEQYDLSQAQVVLEDLPYTGELQYVNPAVTLNGNTLVEGVDYELGGDYGVREEGTYQVTVNGTGLYKGTKSVSFRVLKDSEPDTPEEPQTVRIAGITRYATAIQCAEQMKKIGNETFEGFPSVVVACADNFPDALAGCPLAAQKHAPILLAGKSADGTKETISYIKTNVISGGTVYLLGGTGAVPETVSGELTEAGYEVKRLAGNNRYETNLQIIEEMEWEQGTDVVVVSGKNYADSLSVSGIAGAKNLPILLTSGTLTQEQQNLLDRIRPSNLFVIGGTAAVSEETEEQLGKTGGAVVRIAGENRYKTSVKIAEYFGMEKANAAVFAYGGNFPDGLTGGVLAAEMNAPVLLISNADYGMANEFLKKSRIRDTYFMGGSAVISDETIKALTEP